MSDEDERQCVLLELDRRLLRRGLAMHHAGLLPYAKETVERLFQQGLIKVVFATETLSLGLNMPARSCVISTFTKFDGVSFASLTSGELTQLMGRAGRRGIDTVGHGVILKESDVDLRDIYDAAISGEFAVDSQVLPDLHDGAQPAAHAVRGGRRAAPRQLVRAVPGGRALRALGASKSQPRGGARTTSGCGASSIRASPAPSGP